MESRGSNPFSHQQDLNLARKSSPDRTIKIVLAILGTLAFFFILACGGLGVLIYTATSKSRIADMPDRKTGFQADSQMFNAALRKKMEEQDSMVLDVESNEGAGQNKETKVLDSSTKSVDPNQEVRSWVEATLVKAKKGEPPVLNKQAFVAAVSKNLSREKSSWLNLMLLNQIFRQAEPSPESDGEGVVLNVERNGRFARADLLFQQYNSDTYSVQWFLMEDRGSWCIYDWQRLEYGRRASDEYANYFENLSKPEVDGFDSAMTLLGEAVGNDRVSALRSIRKAETMQMTPMDRHEAMLRTAWTYQLLDSHEDAIRCLQAIQSKSSSWGVWPALQNSRSVLGNKVEAENALREFKKLSPDHPRVHYLMAESLLEQRKKKEAFDHAFHAWRFFPKNHALTQMVLRSIPKESESRFLEAAAKLDDSRAILLDVVERLSWSGGVSSSLVEQLGTQKWMSPELLQCLQLYESREPSNEDEINSRLDISVRLIADAKNDAIRKAAKKWYEGECINRNRFDRLINNKITRKTFLEDVAYSLEFDELWYGRKKTLLALNKVDKSIQNEPMVQALFGWGKLYLEPGDALQHFENCLSELEKSTDENADPSPGKTATHVTLLDDVATDYSAVEPSDVAHRIKLYIAELMFRKDQSLDALVRWGENDSITQSIVEWSIEQKDPVVVKRLREKLLAHGRPSQAWMCLRLEAAEASMRGEFEAANKALILASESLRELNVDSNIGQADRLARLRGIHLMRTQRFDLIPASQDQDLELVLMEAVNSSLSSNDPDGAAKILKAIDASELRSDALERTTLRVKAILASWNSDWKNEVTFQKQLLDLDSGNSNPAALVNWTNAALRAGLLDEVAQKVKDMPVAKQLAVPLANYLLVNKQYDQLRAILRKADAYSAGDWLANPSTLEWLNDNPQVKQQLFDEFAVSVNGFTYRPDTFYQVGFSAAVTELSFDDDELQTRLAERVQRTGQGKSSITLQRFKTPDYDLHTDGWVVCLDQMRFAITTSRESRGKDAILPRDLSPIVAKPMLWITIRALQDSRTNDQDMRLIMSAFADHPNVLVDNDKSFIWYGNNLPDDWFSQHRLAITPETLATFRLNHSDLIESEELNAARYQVVHFSQADRLLGARENKNVIVEVTEGNATEWVPGEWIRMDEDSNRIEVKLTQPSDLVPYLGSGQRVLVYHCYIEVGH